MLTTFNLKYQAFGKKYKSTIIADSEEAAMEKIRNSIKFIAIEKELIEPNKKPFSDAEFEVLWANMFGGVK